MINYWVLNEMLYSPDLDSENIASTSSSIPLTPSSSDTVLTTSNSKDGKILKMIYLLS